MDWFIYSLYYSPSAHEIKEINKFSESLLVNSTFLINEFNYS